MQERSETPKMLKSAGEEAAWECLDWCVQPRPGLLHCRLFSQSPQLTFEGQKSDSKFVKNSKPNLVDNLSWGTFREKIMAKLGNLFQLAPYKL